MKQATIETTEIVKQDEMNQDRHERTLDLLQEDRLSKKLIDHSINQLKFLYFSLCPLHHKS